MPHSTSLYVRILIVAAVFTQLIFSQDRSRLNGWRPYTPTRLEWLAVNLNAEMRVDLSESTEYSMIFVPIENEDAILIYVKYLPSVDRQIMNIGVNTAREVISIGAKSRGWNSWLKVKEHIEMVDPKAK